MGGGPDRRDRAAPRGRAGSWASPNWRASLGRRLDDLESGLDRSEADLSLLLGLADAHFADFLANGRAEGLEIATRDLERAIRRYGSPSGALSAGEGVPGLGFSPEAPDLADGSREATAAVAVRLANGIGRTLETGPVAERLRRWSASCAARYAPILGSDADHPERRGQSGVRGVRRRVRGGERSVVARGDGTRPPSERRPRNSGATLTRSSFPRSEPPLRPVPRERPGISVRSDARTPMTCAG